MINRPEIVERASGAALEGLAKIFAAGIRRKRRIDDIVLGALVSIIRAVAGIKHLVHQSRASTDRSSQKMSTMCPCRDASRSAITDALHSMFCCAWRAAIRNVVEQAEAHRLVFFSVMAEAVSRQGGVHLAGRHVDRRRHVP